MSAVAENPGSPGLGEPDAPYEVVDGEYVEKPMNLLSSLVNRNLVYHLDHFVRTANLGWIVHETLFDMPLTGHKRRPDAAFVSYSLWPADKRIPHQSGFDLRPEIAIEVVSPANSADEVADKLDEYLSEGVKEVWFVYPFHRRIDIFTAPNQCRILRTGDVLTSDRFLPGFSLSLDGIFLECEDYDGVDDE